MVHTPGSKSSSSSPAASPLFPPSTPGATTSPATSVEAQPELDELKVDFSRDKENRDSNLSTITVTPANSSVSLSGNYTVVMVDAGPVGTDETQGQTRHWLVNGASISGEYSVACHCTRFVIFILFS